MASDTITISELEELLLKWLDIAAHLSSRQRWALLAGVARAVREFLVPWVGLDWAATSAYFTIRDRVASIGQLGEP